MTKTNRIYAKDVTFSSVCSFNDNYIEGFATVNGKTFGFQIKRYEETSDYGINEGRISKMTIDSTPDEPYIQYDRQWCRHWRNVPKDLQAVYRAVIKKYN